MKRVFTAILLITAMLLCAIQGNSATSEDTSQYVTSVEKDADGRTITTYDLEGVPTEIFEDIEDKPSISPMSISPMRMLTTTVGGVNLGISLVYDNAYSERVLVPGEELTALLDAQNTTGDEITLNLIIALYADNGKLHTIQYSTNTLGNGESDTFQKSITAPTDSEVTSAKVMVWKEMSVMQPYSDAVVLTLNSEDYFGDDFSVSQPLTAYSDASGTINSATDIDVFAYTAVKEGLYVFESYGETDTYAELFAQSSPASAIANDNDGGDGNNFRLSVTLAAGQTYYLKVHGNNSATGDYKIKAMYAIGNIYGTVSPVKYMGYEPDFNALIESKVTLTTFDTNEFVATMHLKEWSVSSSEYAAFDMTGVHGGTYLVSITRPGYLTRYRKITLNDNVIDLGSVSLLAGDVDGNGVINATDSSLLQSLYNKQYGQAGYNIAADLNGDKIVDSSDLALLTPNLNKNSNIYGETSVNFITTNASRSGSILTVSGVAAANSVLVVNVYRDTTDVYSETVTADASGNYSKTFTLTKAGTYSAMVTSENRVFDATTATVEY